MRKKKKKTRQNYLNCRWWNFGLK